MKRVVMLGGGSGSRDITLALCREHCEVTRVVPAWDSGGSSRALRASLGLLALGDIRQALMTLAHGEGRAGSVVRFFNARLSESADPADLRAEFEFYASGAHPLLARMASDVRAAILAHLQQFRASIPGDFDFCRGSIGNFVLAGADLALGRDINAAIRVFRRLCGIEGQVWPSTTADDVQLSAELRDGRWVLGQDRVTALQGEPARVGIHRVHLARGAAASAEATGPGSDPRPAGASHAGPAPSPLVANPEVLAAIAAADLLLFGPGSFYTSTLAHWQVPGIAEAIAATSPRVPKVFIANILECPETLGRTVVEQSQVLRQAGGPAGLSHVLAHRSWVPFERMRHGFRYLQEGPMTAEAPIWLADDFEDPWHRGRHDAAKVVDVLGRLLA